MSNPRVFMPLGPIIALQTMSAPITVLQIRSAPIIAPQASIFTGRQCDQYSKLGSTKRCDDITMGAYLSCH